MSSLLCSITTSTSVCSVCSLLIILLPVLGLFVLFHSLLLIFWDLVFLIGSTQLEDTTFADFVDWLTPMFSSHVLSSFYSCFTLQREEPKHKTTK